MIDTYYINPEQITNPTPEHFKNLDLRRKITDKGFLEEDISEFNKRNQFIYILMAASSRTRYGRLRREIRTISTLLRLTHNLKHSSLCFHHLKHFTTLRKNYQTVLLLPLVQRTITLDSTVALVMSDAQVFEEFRFQGKPSDAVSHVQPG